MKSRSREECFEHFLLLFGEGVGQRVPGAHDFIQCFRILTVSLETAIARTYVAEVKVF